MSSDPDSHPKPDPASQPIDRMADSVMGESVSASHATDGREFTSEELLQGRREIRIQHGEDVYRLRLTRKGKLILQK